MENNSIHNQERILLENTIPRERQFNLRGCPQCGVDFFGMPGGKDAHCHNCGYKDPCCGD